MVQHAVPNSDIATGSWTAINGGTFWSEMDEGDAATDGDTTCCINPNTDLASTILEVGLTAVTPTNGVPSTGGNYKVRIRAKRFAADTATMTFALRQSGATISSGLANLSTSYLSYDDALGQAEVDSITEAGWGGGLSEQLSKSANAVAARCSTIDLFLPSEVYRYATLLDFDLGVGQEAAEAAVGATFLDFDTTLVNIAALAAIAASLLDMDSLEDQITALANMQATVLDLDLVHSHSAALASIAATILETDILTDGQAALANIAATLLDLSMTSSGVQAGAVVTEQMLATVLDFDVLTAEIAKYAVSHERMSHARVEAILDSAKIDLVHNREC